MKKLHCTVSCILSEIIVNMEAERGDYNHQQGVLHRMLPAVLPVLLISVGYVDPGKWVATVEGGAQFGFDLVAPMLLFSCAAILCQYLSARIAVMTGRDLAQICSDEYDRSTCIFLGVQAELSVVVLDLTMVLGVAHGINLLFGMDLSTGDFLAALDAVLFPIYATFLDHCRARFLCIYAAGFILLSYVFGVLLNQPEISISMTRMPTKLSGESAFALMSILGASIMPHNFYLYSSIVQEHMGPPNISKSALCHNNLFSILCVFGGIYLVNFVLMNSAANVFYSADLGLVTFHDAMSLMEQLTLSSWNLGGQVVLHDFLGLDIPGWLHRATIRIVAMVPAIYCVWTSGPEGIYQMFIFAQVMVALLLPSSVIPLFRVASSRPIMGVYKVSPIVEFLSLVTFMGMLGLKMIFITEMIFGSSDWASNLRLNSGISMSVSFVVLLATACASFSLMLWLAATLLKSASSKSKAHALKWDLNKTVSEMAIGREENELSKTRHLGEEPTYMPERSAAPEKSIETLSNLSFPHYNMSLHEENESTKMRYHGEEPAHMLERSAAPEKSIETCSDLSFPHYNLDLPETIMVSEQEIHLTTVNENSSDGVFANPSSCNSEEPASITESASILVDEVADEIPGTKTLIVEPMKPIEKTVSIDGDSWEPEEPSKPPSGSISSLTPDGSPSFRSLIGKSDDGGNGTGSLSRLAGLGRAARRQLAAILDEFWGQLYDFHGQPTQEAKVKKLDVLLGVDSKPLNVDTSGNLPSIGRRGFDTLNSSSLYNSPKQLKMQNGIDLSYGYLRGSSLWSNHTQLLDAYVQNSSHNVDSGERRYSSLRNVDSGGKSYSSLRSVDSGERRYSSLHAAPSVDAWDYQPATVHGYPIASYLNQIGIERSSDCLNDQMELPASEPTAIVPTNYRGSAAFPSRQKSHNGVNPAQPPGFENVVVSRSSVLQSERSYHDMSFSGRNDNSGISVNTKKYHSLPDISGLSVPRRVSEKSGQWDSSIGYGCPIGQTSYGTSMYSTAGSSAGVPFSFDEPSHLKGYKDALPLPLSSGSATGSLWSRQPFEQFDVAEKSSTAENEALGSGLNSVTWDTAFGVDLETKLLQSFRTVYVAARERFLYDAEARETNQVVNARDSQYLSISSVPHCGEGCIWKADLIISFGVWCIHRILDLSLMESRPELWGKYTYVLNRLQGVIDLAFSKPRTPMSTCFCVQIPQEYQQTLNPAVSNGMLPPAAKPGKAFPKGKENLASVLKRYKGRLSNKPSGTFEGSGPHNVPTSAPMLASYR
ncbi:pentatricopeptide repeat-containing protein [Hibiscus syriacus]|uniref:Pentatricopeptide repeat-containing protein n=1 Tax=Hibiscus syriacus TaxID=106335 RepID=A0A6A3BZG3_HIBSY|nr:pentatricopeptide repeat-containing protein [Hibiscus syriacus]